jgi:hypothetical protein
VSSLRAEASLNRVAAHVNSTARLADWLTRMGQLPPSSGRGLSPWQLGNTTAEVRVSFAIALRSPFEFSDDLVTAGRASCSRDGELRRVVRRSRCGWIRDWGAVAVCL